MLKGNEYVKRVSQLSLRGKYEDGSAECRKDLDAALYDLWEALAALAAGEEQE